MKDKLTCKLKNYIITRDGDFIPEGTPVTVFGWCDGKEDVGKIECRTAVYVYDGEWECEATGACDRSAVGADLFIAVDPCNLVYQGYVQ